MAATTPAALPDRALPNAALRLFLISSEEVLGPAGMQAVLNAARLSHYAGRYPPNNLEYGATFSQYGLLEQAIEEFYGPRGARGLLLRIGRAAFQAGLKEQSAVLGLGGRLSGPALKNMPLWSRQSRMRRLLQQMVVAANKTVSQPARMEENAEAFTVVIDQCMCQHRPPHAQPCCLVTLGTYAEAMHWLTGRPIDVQEITCLNNGADACRYRILKESNERG